MFETRDRTLEHLRAGEGGHAEFMALPFEDQGETALDAEELAGALVGFANAEGGVVILGVDDSGVARGIPREGMDAVERQLLAVATDNCDPPVRLVIRMAFLPGGEEGDRRILLAHVLRGLYVHRTSGGRYYTRVGSTKRDLTRCWRSRVSSANASARSFIMPIELKTDDEGSVAVVAELVEVIGSEPLA